MVRQRGRPFQCSVQVTIDDSGASLVRLLVSVRVRSCQFCLFLALVPATVGTALSAVALTALILLFLYFVLWR
jgi:hypothetical protein